jgi:hypothetical protein
MTYVLDVADDNVEAMEEDPPPSQNVVDPPPPPHDVSTIAQRESLPQLVKLNHPSMAPLIKVLLITIMR